MTCPFAMTSAGTPVAAMAEHMAYLHSNTIMNLLNEQCSSPRVIEMVSLLVTSCSSETRTKSGKSSGHQFSES